MNFWTPDPDRPGEHHPHRADGRRRDGRQRVPAPHRQPGARARLLRRGRGATRRPAWRPTTGWSSSASRSPTTGEHPVTVTLRHTAGERAGAERDRARQVRRRAATARAAACARRSAASSSATRRIHAWGVMDVLAVTDFPDIRTKCAIQSQAGSILHIPREGGYLFRMYVDLGEVSPEDHGAVRSDLARDDHRQGQRHPAPVHARREERRVVQRLRGGAPPHRQVRRRAGGRGPHPARVHHRRRLPHAQREGRAGHERVDAGRLQPRLEARPRAASGAAPSRCWRPTRPSVR